MFERRALVFCRHAQKSQLYITDSHSCAHFSLCLQIRADRSFSGRRRLPAIFHFSRPEASKFLPLLFDKRDGSEKFFDKKALSLKQSIRKQCPCRGTNKETNLCLEQRESDWIQTTRQTDQPLYNRRRKNESIKQRFSNIHTWFDLHGKDIVDWPSDSKYVCAAQSHSSNAWWTVAVGRHGRLWTTKRKTQKRTKVTLKWETTKRAKHKKIGKTKMRIKMKKWRRNRIERQTIQATVIKKRMCFNGRKTTLGKKWVGN